MRAWHWLISITATTALTPPTASHSITAVIVHATTLQRRRAVPPEKPKIFNERGEHIESRAGPYEEGADLQLICVVMGGEFIQNTTHKIYSFPPLRQSSSRISMHIRCPHENRGPAIVPYCCEYCLKFQHVRGWCTAHWQKCTKPAVEPVHRRFHTYVTRHCVLCAALARNAFASECIKYYTILYIHTHF